MDSRGGFKVAGAKGIDADIVVIPGIKEVVDPQIGL